MYPNLNSGTIQPSAPPAPSSVSSSSTTTTTTTPTTSSLSNSTASQPVGFSSFMSQPPNQNPPFPGGSASQPPYPTGPSSQPPYPPGPSSSVPYNNPYAQNNPAGNANKFAPYSLPGSGNQPPPQQGAGGYPQQAYPPQNPNQPSGYPPGQQPPRPQGYQNPYGGSNPYQAPPGNAGYQNPYAPQQGGYPPQQPYQNPYGSNAPPPQQSYQSPYGSNAPPPQQPYQNPYGSNAPPPQQPYQNPYGGNAPPQQSPYQNSYGSNAPPFQNQFGGNAPPPQQPYQNPYGSNPQQPSGAFPPYNPSQQQFQNPGYRPQAGQFNPNSFGSPAINERLRGIAARYEISDALAQRLGILQQFEIVILCDDSGSMNTPVDGTNGTRWDELRSIVQIVMEISTVFDSNGVDVHFLNRPPMSNVTDSRQVIESFTQRPGGLTPLVPALRRIFQSAASKPGSDKRLLVFVATDGAPTDANGNVDIPSLENLMRNERQANTTYVTFLACTDDDSSVAYLSQWDRSMMNVDVVDDYKTEREEIRRTRGYNFPFSFGDYVAKALLGAVDPQMDLMDESGGDNFRRY